MIFMNPTYRILTIFNFLHTFRGSLGPPDASHFRHLNEDSSLFTIMVGAMRSLDSFSSLEK